MPDVSDVQIAEWQTGNRIGPKYRASAAAVIMSADDDYFREIARQIEQTSPDWMVVWGVYTQQFVAFPLFDAPRGTILTAKYPDALIGRMRKAMQALRDSPGREVADESVLRWQHAPVPATLPSVPPAHKSLAAGEVEQ